MTMTTTTDSGEPGAGSEPPVTYDRNTIGLIVGVMTNPRLTPGERAATVCLGHLGEEAPLAGRLEDGTFRLRPEDEAWIADVVRQAERRR